MKDLIPVSRRKSPLPSSLLISPGKGGGDQPGDVELARHRFVFLSCCYESWGGSEELWAGAASILAQNGHSVCALKPRVDFNHPALQTLQSSGCRVQELEAPRWSAARFAHRLVPKWKNLRTRQRLKALASAPAKLRPDLVIVAQAENFDGFHLALMCHELGLPYAVISQKAVNHAWPPDAIREGVRTAFLGARKCYFVSRHNWKLTEAQIGAPLNDAEIVRNPFLVPHDAALPWPSNEKWKLACVGRLYVHDKGQDILLRVLARPKWHARALQVSFFGRGLNAGSLVALAKHLSVQNVEFRGFNSDVLQIWREHHALILPSRAEGLPLALVEAMLCARPAIATDVGGNGEVLHDNATGFLASAPTEKHLDEALERAWQARGSWQEIGQRARHSIRQQIPENPAAVFADELVALVKSVKAS